MNEKHFEIHDATEPLPEKHEGVITKQYGLIPPRGTEKHMPETHHTWDTVAEKLPDLIRTKEIRSVLQQLPILDGTPNSVSDKYLSRASIILNSFARAYYYDSDESDLSQRDTIDPLPESITKPWEQISERLHRNVSVASRTIYDNVICNWKLKDPSKTDFAALTIDDIELVVDITGLKEERTLFLLIVLMEMKFGPAIYQMVEAIGNMKNQEDTEILKNLDRIIHAVKTCTPLLSQLTQHTQVATHVNPQNWHNAVIKLEAPCRYGEKNGGGTATPLFHFMDAFIGRTYDSEFGKLLLSYRTILPTNVIKLIEYIEDKGNAVAEYAKQSGDPALLQKFGELVAAYSEFLETHRRKSVSFIEGMSVDQDTLAHHEPEKQKKLDELDHNLEASIQEREATFKPKPHEAVLLSNKKLSSNVHEIILRVPEKLNFQPGDKCVLSDTDVPGRLYSVSPIVGCPHPLIRLTIKSAGKTSSHLCHLEAGQSVQIKKPYSLPFTLPAKSETPIIMFAGGTGISPFIGFMDARKEQAHSKNMLFLGTRDEKSLYYHDKLEALSQQGHLEYHVIFSQQKNAQGQQGYIDKLIEAHADEIRDAVQQQNAQIYICGSVEFAQTVKGALSHIPTLEYTAQEDVFTHHNQDTLRTITKQELKDSKAERKVWVALNKFVYDLTEFARHHPGGEKVITRLASYIIDKPYARAHGKTPEINSYLENYKIGKLAQEKIVIIGGGLVGITLAGFLANANHNAEITVYDKLPDPREVLLDEKRSINITLCERGLAPLKTIGICDAALSECMPVIGRMYHQSTGQTNTELYGNHGEKLYSVNRAKLARRLALAVSEKYPHIKFNFNHEMLDVDIPNGTAAFKDLSTQQIVHVNADVILGADGLNSPIREKIKTLVAIEETRYSSPQVYKELRIPAGTGNKPLLDPNYLHIWARDKQLMVGFPNIDGSFTISLFYPKDMPIDCSHYAEHFKAHFPDIYELMKDSVEESVDYPQGTLTTLRCYPWIYEGKAALIGDAAHAVFPFYGQGANAGFEDCYVLAQCYSENPGNWVTILHNYQDRRKPNADAISHLAEQHFSTLAKKSTLETHISRKLYQNISFTQMPYRTARNLAIFESKSQHNLTPTPAEGEKFVFCQNVGMLFFAQPRRNTNNPTFQNTQDVPRLNN